MICLVSFGKGVHNKLDTDHFWFFYLSAALFSSYSSWIKKIIFNSSFVGSLGASGAIYAVMGLAMSINPDLRVSLIFLPFFSVNACLHLTFSFSYSDRSYWSCSF